MVAYNAIDNCEDEYGVDSDEKKKDEKEIVGQRNPLMTAYLIEKIVKLYRRSVAADDCSFVQVEYDERNQVVVVSTNNK
jgi:hypothetical protein